MRDDASTGAFRSEVRAFLADRVPAGWAGLGTLDPAGRSEFVHWWRTQLYEARLLAPEWPTAHGGRGASALEAVALAEELARLGLPHGAPNDAFGIHMLGNTLLAWGTEQQQQHFLPRILSGEDRWCQGYSEPDAGSDLASLSCRALRDGDEWVIDGQKIWTSAAHLANWIFVLCRTDPSAPRHRGISFLLCPLDQPGIEVRPIRMMTGQSEFNELFFTGARTAAAHTVGGAHNGWAVAMTLLGFERGAAAATQPIEFRAELDRLIALARERGRIEDPLVRDRLAWCYARVEQMRFLGQRTIARLAAGAAPGPGDASVSKLVWSEYHQVVTALAVDLLGLETLVPSGRPPAGAFRTDDLGAPNTSASWVGTFLNARAGTVYAGTSQIQRNIIAELALGLPKEPRGTGEL